MVRELIPARAIAKNIKLLIIEYIYIYDKLECEQHIKQCPVSEIQEKLPFIDSYLCQSLVRKRVRIVAV